MKISDAAKLLGISTGYNTLYYEKKELLLQKKNK